MVKLKTLSWGEKKRKKNSDEGRREKGEKPQGYLPTLEAKVKIILKRREKREKKKEKTNQSPTWT
jgi:hypothetical protein